MSVKVFLPSLLVLALAACAVGPDYKAQQLEAANITAATDAKQYDHAKFEGIWWQQFEDPTLNQLVTQSLSGNRDLRVAFARLRAARAIRDDASNDAMPTITSRASSDLAKRQIPGQTTRRVNSERYDLGLDMAWELDLFGRIQRNLEASDADQQAEQVRERNRIATLLGQRPDKLSVDLSPANLPAIAKALPIGDPGQLLQRRPDILSAERKLAAATARIGVAKADLFPRVSLSGFLGFTAGRGSQIGSSAANAWALGPSITWAAFDLGSVRARLRGADAEADGALATYEQQVLLALEESENAFSDYGKRQQRLVSLIRQSESSRAAADLAQIRYREGTADFLVLLDAQRERLAAEDAQALAEVDLYRGIVAIYKALGGGWQPDTVVATLK